MSLVSYRERHHLFQGESWATKCGDCGQVLTKYDRNEEESRAIAAGVPKHECPRGLRRSP